MGKRATKSLYSPHPSIAMGEAYTEKLKERTGRTLQQWIALITKEGPATEKERRAWLKKEHGLTTNYAWWVVERAEGRGVTAEYNPEAYVEAMFSGAKAGLLPLYHELLHLCINLGDDVKACPGKTIVPLYRTHVFAQIKPSTRTRIDLGLCLKGHSEALPERLLDTVGLAKGDRITHRIPVVERGDIDDELKFWLKCAYDLDS